MYNEALINSDVCITCGACCSVYVDPNTDEVLALEDVNEDSILVSCPHLISSVDRHVCGVYNDRPKTCRTYHCLKQANDKGLEIKEDTVIGSRIIKSILITHDIDLNASLTQW